ncbi:MAG: BNR-repeat neuraminidase N-terminal domain-containing protein, partial [Bacteroidota bacterium]
MIRKLLFALTVVVLFSNSQKANATVAGYSFASSTGNYLAITGTTLYTGTWDDNNSALITIPFTFTYNNVAYTTVSISTNGFITMGAIPSTVYCGLQTSSSNSIAGYGTDLVGSSTSTIQYTTRGTSPNRQFVVQWADCDHYGNSNANHWTFQVVLNETSNTVQVAWGSSTDTVTMGPNTCSDAVTESGNVGLLGSSASDFNIRSVTNGTNTWATSTVGTALTDVCNMSSTNIPAPGLTYTWNPGATVAMSYTSATTAFLNNTQSVPQGSTLNQILQVRIVTTGTLTPFNVTSLSLATTGSTNAALDISNAKVYFTGLSAAFSSSTQFGSTATGPNGAYTMNGSATLAEGTNYFWITYDISGTANYGDILSGCCTQVVGSGTMGTRFPSVTCPSGSQTISQIGAWSVVTTAPHSSGGGMLLLSDGTVICKTFSGGADGYGNLWDKLTPNANGSYTNGTWSTLAPMTNTRLYFSAQVLKDGRVYVAGGEYGTGLQQAETYNPLTNTWTPAPSPGQNISDANSEILEDGRIVQALVAGNLKGTTIYNPTLNTFTAGPACNGIHNESAWVKLPDNSILFVDRLSTTSERYIPASNIWVTDATVPVALYDPFGDETGGALLLPDGRAFFLGSLGHTA